VLDTKTNYATAEKVEANRITFDSNNVSSDEANLYSQVESSSNYRNNTFTNPINSYDFKCGHYLGI
jgi:hypothetical protein